MKKYLEDLTEHDHKLQYNLALEIAGVQGPTWEDLTEHQREDMRNLHLMEILAVNNCSEFIVTREDNVQTNLVSGNYNTVCQQVNNPNFKCRKCSSSYIVYRDWESSCGGYEDTHYKCVDCGFDWWVEGIDS